jgi:hypothetical protein
MQTMLKEESTELLRHVENKMGAIEFMGIFSEIQRKVEKIKHDKKRRMKAEAVSNPAAYAKKKVSCCYFIYIFVLLGLIFINLFLDGKELA